MDKFVQKVRQTMDTHHMLETNEPVLVALSGGADSVALLLALTELEIPVSACHLHHGLRGAEADRDEQFCRSLCAKLGIALTVRHADAAAYAREVHESVETAARNLRYAFFAEIADGRRTATAHTADDNLETVLFHLARGSGLDGLCGIPPVREGIVRPLIACTREEIEAFLAFRRQEFVTDSTNLQPAYTRNRIRQEVVPVLRALNPQAAETVSALTARLRTDRDYLEEQAQALLSQAAQDGGWRAELLADAHPALRTRALRIACQQSGMPARDFTARHVAALEALLRNPNPSAQIDLPAGFAARREYDLLRVGKKQKPADFEQIPVRIPFDGRLGAGAARVTVRPVQKNQVFYNSFNTFYVGCDTIDIPTFVLRTRRTGDRLRLNRHGGSRPLKKILIDKKIPAPQRGTLAVLADQNGVIAVQSVGTDISRCPGEGGIFEIRFEG